MRLAKAFRFSYPSRAICTSSKKCGSSLSSSACEPSTIAFPGAGWKSTRIILAPATTPCAVICITSRMPSTPLAAQADRMWWVDAIRHPRQVFDDRHMGKIYKVAVRVADVRLHSAQSENYFLIAFARPDFSQYRSDGCRTTWLMGFLRLSTTASRSAIK